MLSKLNFNTSTFLHKCTHKLHLTAFFHVNWVSFGPLIFLVYLFQICPLFHNRLKEFISLLTPIQQVIPL